jgi:hypothetical protein
MLNKTVCQCCDNFRDFVGTPSEGAADSMWDKGWCSCSLSLHIVTFKHMRRLREGIEVRETMASVAKTDGKPPKGCPWRLEHVVSQEKA